MSTDREKVFTVSFYNDGYYRHINAYIGLMPERDKDNNLDLRYTGTMYSSDDPFARVKVTSQTDRDSLRRAQETGENPVYGETVVWDEAFDLRNAEHAVKALRKIDKYLNDAREMAGHYHSIGQFIIRVIKACKVRRVIMKWDDSHQVFSADYAGDLIDRKVREWQNEVCGITTNS